MKTLNCLAIIGLGTICWVVAKTTYYAYDLIHGPVHVKSYIRFKDKKEES